MPRRPPPAARTGRVRLVGQGGSPQGRARADGHRLRGTRRRPHRLPRRTGTNNGASGGSLLVTHPLTEPDRSAAFPVEVLWRPGCPSCRSLRRDLRRRGVAAVWTNIWEDDGARQRVRTANGGNETVPTVVIGGTTLTNPSGRQVAALLDGSVDLGQRPSRRRAWLSWLPVVFLVTTSEVVSRQGHPTGSWGIDALAVGAWWVTRPLRR
ncbi:MAG: glutaredoxin domain-containing protein [Nocardioidaceae bacterium]